ncbi:MAG: alpha-amylase family glycosyl hydrolase [Acidobacteriaceae bacterium]
MPSGYGSQPAVAVRYRQRTDRPQWKDGIAFPRRLSVFVSLLVLCAGQSFSAPIHRTRHRGTSAQPEKPVVVETDPPIWWSGLPNPMLLLRGKNLTGAQVHSSVDGIAVRRTKISANGHWEFVWLDISNAAPQHFDLVVRTTGGEVRVPYELRRRHAPTDGFHGFSSADVMYLIMPDRFSDGNLSNDRLSSMPGTFDRSKPRAYHGGDLQGIENHLDYLQKLGVTTIWITPLYAQDPRSPADYHGYSAVDMYAVNPHFGTLRDYEHLAEALHSRGMKLVLDTVPNHVGPKNPWVLDPPAPDWFHGTLASHLEANGNFAPITDPHAPPAAYRAAVDGWFANVLPDLNQSNPLVKQYLIQNAIWWIESGTLDGLRLDTFPYVDRAFWQGFHAELHALYPHLTTVGEIFNLDPAIVSYFAGGVKHQGIDTGLYTPFDFPTYFALRATLTGTSSSGDLSMTKLESIQRRDWLYPHAERLVTFLGNHDTGRFMSEPAVTMARMKLAFGLLATMRGMPQIYYGDEIAMTGGNDPDNRRNFPGGFPGDRNNAFTAAGRTPEQSSMHDWVQGLFQLRARHGVLETGAQQDLLADDTGFVFARVEAPVSGKPIAATAQGEIVLVLMNKSDSARMFHLDFSHTALEGVRSLAPLWNTKENVVVDRNHCDITLEPEQLIAFEAQR